MTGELDYLASIHHDGSSRYVKPDKNIAALGSDVQLRLRAAVSAPIERILLRTSPDGEQHFAEMSLKSKDRACQWWQASLHLNMPSTSYRFLIFTRDGVWWYNGSGLHRNIPTDAEDFRLLANYQAPEWVRSSVFYQIFPDRFADGDPTNNVRDGEYSYRGHSVKTRRWGEPPARTGWPVVGEFYGGDLAGIEAHLDYLQMLGINALYLNPIFTAHSNHRYDVIDYYHVDPHLGGDQALASLRKATAGSGMRLILDIVPNHCGVDHPWFQAAQADPAAPTFDYFTFYHHPDDYACWLGVRSLPKLNYRSPGLRQAMYASKDSIFRHWLRPPYAVDGWRLDVANMLARQGADQLGMEVGHGIRQAVKEENPQAYLMGENFFDASPQLQGDCWDAVMNYSGFAKPLWYWLGGFSVHQHGSPQQVISPISWSTQALVDTWQAFRASIPWEIARQQYNLLGSHDTERILTVTKGDRTMARLAAGILMTYPGVPSIYYGDEIGLGASPGASARDCMAWEPVNWDEEMLSFYRTMVHLRRNSPALIEGGFQVLLVETNTFAYLRDTDSEQIVVVAQRAGSAHPPGTIPVWQAGIPDGTVFADLFEAKQAPVSNGQLPLGTLVPGIQIWQAKSS